MNRANGRTTPAPSRGRRLFLPAASSAFVSLLLEAAVGYPDAAFRLVRHPVVWIGALIGRLDRRFNQDDAPDAFRRACGVVACVAIVGAAVIPCLVVERAMVRWLEPVAAVAVIGILAAPLLAQRSLHLHVAAVADALDAGGLEGGRVAVSRIVGRNPATLDAAGVVRAAIESLAENFSDGVVAPACWLLVCGLPGIAGYKAINTADSMIGHRTPRHTAFGWASARLDDLLNLPASRLAALWLIGAALTTPGADPSAGWRAVRRDAGRHRSPNAGWPEAAMAGALGLRLAGPRTYGATRVDDAWMGDGRADATVTDLRRALSLYRRACGLQMVATLLLALVIELIGRG